LGRRGPDRQPVLDPRGVQRHPRRLVGGPSLLAPRRWRPAALALLLVAHHLRRDGRLPVWVIRAQLLADAAVARLATADGHDAKEMPMLAAHLFHADANGHGSILVSNRGQ